MGMLPISNIGKKMTKVDTWQMITPKRNAI
jgi:hypothetical protein